MRKRLVKLARAAVKVALLAGLGLGGWFGYHHYFPAVEEDLLGAIPTAAAEVRDLTVSVQATGVLRPVRIIEIKSKASGEVLEMPVEMGDFVAAGDLIAQIDTNILDQELKQAQADLESARTRLAIADNQLQRARSLYDQDLISATELEQSEQTFITAEAQLLRNEAEVELARERLADATVRAPAAGTIINKTVEEGQIIASSTSNVSGGTTLVQMADLSELEIRTLVDEVDIGQVRIGLAVESRVEAFPDATFEGTVVMIEPQAVVQQSVTTFPVLSRIDNAEGKLLPGMNADVSIVIHRKPQVLTLPNEAVRTPADALQVTGLLAIDDPNNPGAQLAAGGGRGGGRGGGDAARSGQGRGARQRGQGGGPGGGGFGGSGGRGQRGERPGASVADGGGGRSGGSENAAAEEFAARLERIRGNEVEEDRDPFGVEGRREAAVVFVRDAAGVISTKDIVVGARDWAYTEVLDGVVEGEQVLVLPSTSLLESQDRIRNWARDRSGIPGLGGGGGPGGFRGPGRGRF